MQVTHARYVTLRAFTPNIYIYIIILLIDILRLDRVDAFGVEFCGNVIYIVLCEMNIEDILNDCGLSSYIQVFEGEYDISFNY